MIANGTLCVHDIIVSFCTHGYKSDTGG